MSLEIPQGISRTEKFIVEDAHVAKHVGSGNVEVLSTPSMILFMEIVSLHCAQEHLPEGWTTVGTRVDVRHLKPTRIGKEVTIKVVLEERKGKKLVFSVVAFEDATVKIGEGVHERYIVDKEKFLSQI